MKWLQHDSDALEDRKLVDLAMKYGAEGIGVYWTVVERIAKKMDVGNPTLELEEETPHLVRILCDHTPGDRIDAILKYCEDLGLFDRGPGGRIRCRTLFRKLDNFTAGNPKMKKMREEMRRFVGDNYVDNSHFEVTSKSLYTPTYLHTNKQDLPARAKYPSAEEIFEQERIKREKAI